MVHYYVRVNIDNPSSYDPTVITGFCIKPQTGELKGLSQETETGFIMTGERITGEESGGYKKKSPASRKFVKKCPTFAETCWTFYLAAFLVSYWLTACTRIFSSAAANEYIWKHA
jgi:hypothetical protein